ncbi:MAG: protein phosphatase 2C domain-containing protein [Deltaproteobacteria bacterium]|nr:protein phosphatase 2C domain-containing protein [Deltaproteobacteria bacterium]MBW2256406.1 protein phosphatase 2C domain-containing protein [Deltaproteobacteria bacterium]
MQRSNTPAEFIGTGALWSTARPDAQVHYPRPFPSGMAMGQHLSVERLIRVAENRLIYLVNNLSRKWKRRKCWACGNKYSPDTARCCTFCGHQLGDLRFLMTARWQKELYPGFEAFTKKHIRHFGLLTPVYAFYRHNMMMAVYHYDDAALLLDVASPLPSTHVLRLAKQLSGTLAYLHQQGVVLHPFRSANVVLMPDSSVRWFDLEVERMALTASHLYRDPAQPVLRDVKNLAALLGDYVSPGDLEMVEFLHAVAHGIFPGPIPLNEAVSRMLLLRTGQAVDPSTSSAAAAYTDLGLYRSRNEDTWAWRKLSDRVWLYAVADGMGGHDEGAQAAHLAVDVLAARLSEGLVPEKLDADTLRELMFAAFTKANTAVYETRLAQRSEMGCTLTALLVVDDHQLYLGHVGDSRAYLLQKGKLQLLTTDHTVATELVEEGALTTAQALTHKSRHILTSAIGAEPSLAELDFLPVEAKRGDRVLLCSDGLTNEIPDTELAVWLQKWADRQKAVRELVREAYDRGGHDNLTVIVVDLQ